MLLDSDTVGKKPGPAGIQGRNCISRAVIKFRDIIQLILGYDESLFMGGDGIRIRGSLDGFCGHRLGHVRN